MELHDQFIEYVQKGNLFQKNDRLLLAVSGGVDSVVMCALCKQAGFDFSIAHCNFQLRGAESDADEKFVQELAGHYGVGYYVKKFETEKYASENKVSIQVAARELRYAWFYELRNELNSPPIRYILTAHHANDNIETLLMNFFKGTGIAGLQGIKPKSGEQHQLVRPLLFVKKEELVHFAQANNLRFREDASNSMDKYTRNYFRNTLIPSLQEVYPKVEDNLLDNIRRFTDTEVLYREALDIKKRKLLVQKGKEVHIPVLKLLKQEALHTIVYEIIREYGFTATQVDEVIHLLKSESGKYISSRTHRILHNRNWLIITKLAETNAMHLLIEASDRSLNFSGQTLHIEKTGLPLKIDNQSIVAQLDAKEIRYPLLLRTWKKGDYFYPLGMKKKKKLSRFFIDQKLSLIEKENTWVIESGKKIIWVVGMRIDERFKLTTQTTAVLKFTITKNKPD